MWLPHPAIKTNAFQITSGNPILPKPGYWENEGGWFGFYVSPDSYEVLEIFLRFTVETCGSYRVRRTVPFPLISNEFTFAGSFYGEGQFDGSQSASGITGLDNLEIPDCGFIDGGPWEWEASWVDNSQPDGTIEGGELEVQKMSPAP